MSHLAYTCRSPMKDRAPFWGTGLYRFMFTRTRLTTTCFRTRVCEWSFHHGSNSGDGSHQHQHLERKQQMLGWQACGFDFHMRRQLAILHFHGHHGRIVFAVSFSVSPWFPISMSVTICAAACYGYRALNSMTPGSSPCYKFAAALNPADFSAAPWL